MIFFPVNNHIEGIFHSFFFDFPNEQKKVVEIKASSHYWGDVYNVISYVEDWRDVQTCYATNNLTDSQNLVFKLLKNKVRVTHYSLKTRPYEKVNFLRSWAFQGSNDGQNWNTLHSVTDSTLLIGNNITQTFAVNQKRVYSYFRLILTGPNWSNQHYLVLQNLEIFGRLCGNGVEDNKCMLPILSSCHHASKNYFHLFILLVC